MTTAELRDAALKSNDAAITLAESSLAQQIQQAESQVIAEARSFRRGGAGMGRLFDAIDAAERLYDRRETLGRKRRVAEHLARIAGSGRRVL